MLVQLSPDARDREPKRDQRNSEPEPERDLAPAPSGSVHHLITRPGSPSGDVIAIDTRMFPQFAILLEFLSGF